MFWIGEPNTNRFGQTKVASEDQIKKLKPEKQLIIEIKLENESNFSETALPCYEPLERRREAKIAEEGRSWVLF